MSWFYARKAGLAAALALWLVAGGVLAGRCRAESEIDFINDVMPLLDKLGCSQCHAAGGGKGGLKLSMFGAEPEHDYAALARSRGGRLVDRIEPAKSLFLLKATESIPHEGGQKIEVDSPERCRRRLTTFSTPTMASSTSSPTAMARPPSVIVLMVSPIAANKMPAVAKDSGRRRLSASRPGPMA